MITIRKWSLRQHTVFSTETELRKHLYLSLKQIATLSVFKRQLKRLAYRVETAGPVVATATVATTMCVKVPHYRKDMLVRAKLQFEGFDNATLPQKPHWVRSLCGLCLLYVTSLKFSRQAPSLVEVL